MGESSLLAGIDSDDDERGAWSGVLFRSICSFTTGITARACGEGAVEFVAESSALCKSGVEGFEDTAGVIGLFESFCESCLGAFGDGSGFIGSVEAVIPGGGGSGAIPTFLSVAAAAAAAEAYFKVSPAGLVGIGAGFIELPLPGNGGIGTVDDEGLCSVARAGIGDRNCVEGLLAEDAGSLQCIGLSFISSCTDCVSWLDILSSRPMP